MNQGHWKTDRKPSPAEQCEAERKIAEAKGLAHGDDLWGFCGFCNVQGHCSFECTALSKKETQDEVE